MAESRPSFFIIVGQIFLIELLARPPRISEGVFAGEKDNGRKRMLLCGNYHKEAKLQTEDKLVYNAIIPLN